MTAERPPPYEVFIPARNAARTLLLPLRSLSTQSHPPLRITVIDDGSSDATAEVASSEGATCFRTRGVGLAAAQNLALERCRAPFVAFVDADDAWKVHAGWRLAALLEGHRTAIAVGGRADVFDSSTAVSTVLRECELSKSGSNAPTRNVTPAALWRRNCLTKSATMFRTDGVRSIGGYRELPSAEDYDLLLRLLASGSEVVLTEDSLCMRMVAKTSMTANSAKMFEGEIAALELFHHSARRDSAAHLPGASHLALHSRRLAAWRRAVVRDLQYHGHLHSVPAPPLPARLSWTVHAAITSSWGERLARGAVRLVRHGDRL